MEIKIRVSVFDSTKKLSSSTKIDSNIHLEFRGKRTTLISLLSMYMRFNMTEKKYEITIKTIDDENKNQHYPFNKFKVFSIANAKEDVKWE